MTRAPVYYYGLIFFALNSMYSIRRLKRIRGYFMLLAKFCKDYSGFIIMVNGVLDGAEKKISRIVFG